jgi:hypothetical protein
MANQIRKMRLQMELGEQNFGRMKHSPDFDLRQLRVKGEFPINCETKIIGRMDLHQQSFSSSIVLSAFFFGDIFFFTIIVAAEPDIVKDNLT